MRLSVETVGISNTFFAQRGISIELVNSPIASRKFFNTDTLEKFAFGKAVRVERMVALEPRG